MKLAIVLGVGGTLLLSCSATNKRNKEASVKPNVIFLVADDIGYGDLSCNGAKAINTPNVDKLARKGVRFTNAHAVAATSTPSRYSLFTGHYAWRRNDTGIATGDAKMIIHPDQSTIADLFQDCGYMTGAIGKWHLGLGSETGSQNWNDLVTPGPQDIGFKYSYIMAATGDRVPCVFMENQRVVNLDLNDPISVSYKDPFIGEPLGKDHPELLTKLKPSHGHDMAIVNGISRIGYMKGGKQALWEDENIADSIVCKAIQFIDEYKDHPFFLYVGTNDIHVPRWPHSRFVGKSGMGPRGDSLLQFDWTVGQILQALEDNGILENTFIVLTSDNGPVVDDGYVDQALELLGEHKPGGPLRGGKYSNFEGGTRVPMIVHWPDQVKAKVSNALISQIDLYASMASLLGQPLEKGEAPDSQDYLSAFMGVDRKGREYVVEAAGALSVSDHEWKYIMPSNGPAYNKTEIELGNSKEEQLYHLESDLSEQKNVAADNPKIVKRLRAILENEGARQEY